MKGHRITDKIQEYDVAGLKILATAIMGAWEMKSRQGEVKDPKDPDFCLFQTVQALASTIIHHIEKHQPLLIVRAEKTREYIFSFEQDCVATGGQSKWLGKSIEELLTNEGVFDMLESNPAMERTAKEIELAWKENRDAEAS